MGDFTSVRLASGAGPPVVKPPSLASVAGELGCGAAAGAGGRTTSWCEPAFITRRMRTRLPAALHFQLGDPGLDGQIDQLLYLF